RGFGFLQHGGVAFGTGAGIALHERDGEQKQSHGQPAHEREPLQIARRTGVERRRREKENRPRPVQHLDRPWTVFFFTTPAFDARSPRYLQWFALVGGLTVTLFLFAITFVQGNARARAERDAAMLQKSEAA